MDGNDRTRDEGRRTRSFFFLLLSPFFLLASTVMAQNPPSAQPKQQGLSGLNTQEFDNKSKQSINWQNNPFVQPANDVAVSDLKLTGIAYSKTSAAVIINDQVLDKGDKIGSHEVVDISANNVVMKNENGVFNLSFKAGGGSVTK